MENDRKNELITNSANGNLLNVLVNLIKECDRFFVSVAFVRYGGLQLLLDSLFDFSKSEDKLGKIITTDYQYFTDTKSLKKLDSFKPNIETKIFRTEKHNKGFHTKAYIFETDEEYKIIIGSSNITQAALKENIEWNSYITASKSDYYSSKVIKEFYSLWEITEEITDEFLVNYEKALEKLKNIQNKINQKVYQEFDIIEKPFQKEACERLEEIRKSSSKALIIAATGTGKTILSAFDVKQFNPKKVLFLAHREDIIRKSEEAYRKVLGSRIETGFFVGTEKSRDARYIFSTIQTMGRNYRRFDPFEFDYIVYDEAHHVAANQYKNVRDHFRPRFSLGMTATPERMDGVDIYSMFDNNVGLDLRLREALDQGLVAPFHYFGINEIDDIQLDKSTENDLNKLVKKLCISKRVNYIIEKMNHYGFDGNKRKCLGFCADTNHARFMTEEFNKRGIASELINADIEPKQRQLLIERLEDDKDPLEVIFTIDVLNEGIDIPSINQVLLLRPTRSSMIFIQQLGRGLRKHKDKNYLTVLDFIGNHSRAFLIAIALYGSKGLDKRRLKEFVKNDFNDFNKLCHIKMDLIVKERILSQIEREKFYSNKYLLQEFYSLKEILRRDPIYMMDFESYEYGIDADNFLVRNDSYFQFLLDNAKLDSEYAKYKNDKVFLQLLKQLSELLPLKRIHEFTLINELMAGSIAKDDYYKLIEKQLGSVSKQTCDHAIKNLNLEFRNSIQKKNDIEIIKVDENNISLSSIFLDEILDEIKKELINDVIQFGLVKYKKIFGLKDFGSPFIKLFETYQTKDVQLIANYAAKDTWMKGVQLYKNNIYLFVNLIKNKDTPESQNYKDEISSRTEMTWQAISNMNSKTKMGEKLINYKKYGFKLHLLVRRRSSESGITLPYFYLGEVDAVVLKDETPTQFRLEFKNELPEEIYEEISGYSDESHSGASREKNVV